MSKGKCKEALLLACKLVGKQDRILGLRNVKITTEVQRLKSTCSHEELFFEEALKATRALSQLRRETEEKTKDSARALSPLRRELEQQTKQCGDLAKGIKTAADQLRMLVSDTASKPVAANRQHPELLPQLETAVANVKQIPDSERKKTKRLQDQVKYFKKKLDAYREPDSSEEVKALQAQLEVYKAEGSAAMKRADALAEKLRCQICMDRERDRAFACGHTCCKQCSVEWEKCIFNCVSERRQKPVKFTFPLYFN